MFGSMPDFDRLVAAAHERGLKVLLDLVACHTSIQHAWFRDHPDWYIWSKGDRPPNNWTSAFGGPAWSRYDDEHWYLHSFYPEQPDLDWRNPEVVAAMQEVVRFWVARGADGFRLDAIDRLAKDPELRDDPPSDEPFGLPLLEHELGRDLRYSRNAEWIGEALGAIREAAGDALLIGEVYLPAAKHAPYLEHLDRSFVFELIQSPWEPERLRAARRRRRGDRGPQRPGRGVGAVEPRLRALPDALRPRERARRGAPADDASRHRDPVPGRRDRAGHGPRRRSAVRPRRPRRVPPPDAVGRDARAAASAPRSRGCPLDDPAERNVADQRDDPGLAAVRSGVELIALRRDLGAGLSHARRASRA